MWSDAIAPVPVGPPEVYEGVRSVVIGSNVRWLKKLCFRHSAFQSLEAHYIHLAIQEIRGQLSGDGQEESAKDVGAVCLQEGHSSQEEESAEQGSVDVKRKRTRTRRPPQWCTIELQDTPVRMIVLRSSGLRIEYTGEAITAFCSRVQMVRRREESLALPDWSNLLHAADDNRIEWNHLRKFFCVHTRDLQGRKKRKHFAVKHSDGAVQPYAVLQLARRYWNQEDSGPSERYAADFLSGTREGENAVELP